MKITHNQFVIELLSKDGKFYATANRIYDCGCTSELFDTPYEALAAVVKTASTLRTCNDCCGKCPKDCKCPWDEDRDYRARKFLFEYWSYEQNRAEDPVGYENFLNAIKAGIL